MSRILAPILAWVQASRPLAQVNVAVPLLLGQGLAYATHGVFSWRAFAFIHAFGLLDQLFIVYANDYADAETDRINETPSVYSGGSRVIPDGKLTPHSLRLGAWVMAGLLVALSVWSGFELGRPLMLGACALALALLWAYSFPPFRLNYRGSGEALQGLGLGVLLPLLAFYLQAGSLEGFPWFAAGPLFLLGYVGNVTTALPDYPSDRASDKRTYAVRFGQYRARRHSLELLALASFCSPLVVPAMAWPFHLALCIAVLALLGTNLRLLGSADAQNPGECLRFVTVNSTALNLLLAGWTLGLFFSR
jgi:1,4-dihydroxy-2-naphthoate octaprenyltransferase